MVEVVEEEEEEEEDVRIDDLRLQSWMLFVIM
jgi:hypothetical protein